MQLITKPDGWKVRESPNMKQDITPFGLCKPVGFRASEEDPQHIPPKEYDGIGPKPPFPDGELPENLIGWKYQCRYGTSGEWEECTERYFNHTPHTKRQVAIYTPQDAPQRFKTEDEINKYANDAFPLKDQALQKRLFIHKYVTDLKNRSVQTQEEKSLREQAMAWWNGLSEEDKTNHYTKYRPFTPATNHSQFTGREIQNIWAVVTTPAHEVAEESQEDHLLHALLEIYKLTLTSHPGKIMFQGIASEAIKKHTGKDPYYLIHRKQ